MVAPTDFSNNSQLKADRPRSPNAKVLCFATQHKAILENLTVATVVTREVKWLEEGEVNAL